MHHLTRETQKQHTAMIVIGDEYTKGNGDWRLLSNGIQSDMGFHYRMSRINIKEPKFKARKGCFGSIANNGLVGKNH